MKERINLKKLVFLLLSCLILTSCASPSTNIIDVDTDNVNLGISVGDENNISDTDILIENNDDIIDIPTTDTGTPENTESEDVKSPETSGDISEPETPETPDLFQLNIGDMTLSGREVILYGDFSDGLKEELESIMGSYDKNISVAVYSLDKTKGLIYNGNQEYFSACTIKALWMLYLCKEIDDGNIDKNTIITYEEKHYHDGSGTIRKGSYGDQYTIEQLINLCLSISDNVAYEMLVQEVIDRNDFYEFLNSLNLNRLYIPTWSLWSSNSIPTDYLIIWEAIYHYLETNTDGAQILKKACTNTKWNYGSATVTNFDYSHKSGDNWEPNAAHNDAGIIWADTPYLYAIFTNSEGNDYDENVIDEVMTLIHQEFQKTNK